MNSKRLISAFLTLVMLIGTLAVGVDAIFAEVHPNPDKAFSDAANQLKLSEIENILRQAVEIDKIIKSSK